MASDSAQPSTAPPRFAFGNRFRGARAELGRFAHRYPDIEPAELEQWVGALARHATLHARLLDVLTGCAVAQPQAAAVGRALATSSAWTAEDRIRIAEWIHAHRCVEAELFLGDDLAVFPPQAGSSCLGSTLHARACHSLGSEIPPQLFVGEEACLASDAVAAIGASPELRYGAALRCFHGEQTPGTAQALLVAAA